MSDYVPEKPSPIYDLLKSGKRVVSNQRGGWDQDVYDHFYIDGVSQYDLDGFDYDLANDATDLRVIRLELARPGEYEDEWFLVEGKALEYRILDKRISDAGWAVYPLKRILSDSHFTHFAQQALSQLEDLIEELQKQLVDIRSQMTHAEVRLLGIEQAKNKAGNAE